MSHCYFCDSDFVSGRPCRTPEQARACAETKFQIHLGYDHNGRERNRYFQTIEAASAFCAAAFARTGVVLSIIRA